MQMKLCQSHWDAMVIGINERGLNDFCPHTQEDMIARLKMQSKGDTTIDSFNPAIFANTVILSNTVKKHGQELIKLDEMTSMQKILKKLFKKEPKERVICPVCYFYQDNLIPVACNEAKKETMRLVKLADGAPQ